jgi:hypothetical protein
MANDTPGWLAHAIEHIRSLENVRSVEPLHWASDDEYLVYVTPTEPTQPPGGGWAQPSEPLYLLLGPDGWRTAEPTEWALH